MSEGYNNVLGFYLTIGSEDYPSSWSPNKPFGFSGVANSKAVFNSSFSDMLNAFNEPLTATKRFSIQTPPVSTISSLTIEKPCELFDATSIGSDLDSNVWNSVFKIIEYVSINQDKTGLTEIFENDMYLNNKIITTSINPYIKNSLSISRSVNVSRLDFINFSINFKGNGTSPWVNTTKYLKDDMVNFNGDDYRAVVDNTGTLPYTTVTVGTVTTITPSPKWTKVDSDVVTFKIYFNPDKLLINETKKRYQIYLYEDLSKVSTNSSEMNPDGTGDNLISSTEWRSQIVEKHLGIFENARYKHYQTLETRFVYNTKDALGKIQFTMHMFVIYTLVKDQLTTQECENAVKDFLLNTTRISIGRPYDYSECVYHYPDLFVSRFVDLHPIRNISDVYYIPSGSNKFIHPVTYGKIFKELVLHADTSDENFNNAEVIYVGSEDIVPSEIKFPILAISSSTDDKLPPISSVYQSYIPLYKPFDITTYPTIPQNDPTIFHRLLLVSLKLLSDDVGEKITSSNPLVTGIIGTNGNIFKFSINNKPNSTTDIASVSFVLVGTSYFVHAMV